MLIEIDRYLNSMLHQRSKKNRDTSFIRYGRYTYDILLWPKQFVININFDAL